jgi:hypothetical protein
MSGALTLTHDRLLGCSLYDVCDPKRGNCLRQYGEFRRLQDSLRTASANHGRLFSLRGIRWNLVNGKLLKHRLYTH